MKSRRGLGCSPGVVRGRARWITDPRTESPRPGEILVAERVDPGWIALFAGAAGLLVERGSVLSHAAIVARELGLPMVSSIAGLADWLHDGEPIELDGGRGTVNKLPSNLPAGDVP